MEAGADGEHRKVRLKLVNRSTLLHHAKGLRGRGRAKRCEDIAFNDHVPASNRGEDGYCRDVVRTFEMSRRRACCRSSVMLVVLIGCAGGRALRPGQGDGSAGAPGGAGGSSTGSSGASGKTGTSGAAGAISGGGGATSDAGVRVESPCPPQPPADGTSCAQEGLTCAWGDDVRGDMCRTQASCMSGHWQVTPPRAAACPALQDSGACPADTSGTCTLNTTCTRADGIVCHCVDCRPNVAICSVGPPSWYCPMPVSAAGCPATTEPNFGTPCDVEGAVCSYFWFMCGQPERVCSHGLWTPGQEIGCPASSRRVKKDIRYLSLDEVRATAAQALRLRLATYEYKAPPYAGRRHLGFIIEDSPTVPAVDRDGDMVDLYGYTSMLLATTQAQQQQIQALQKQVQALSRAVEQLSPRRIDSPRKIDPR
jgi:hypothetical protein